MTHISLCSGIGGIDKAAEAAGFQTTAVCEIDPNCRAVLAERYPNALHLEDLNAITVESLRAAGVEAPTLLSAGIPCQPFSMAGKRHGADDPHGRHLWPVVAELIRGLAPRWVLVENVRGILSIDGGAVISRIHGDLADMGYRSGHLCFGVDVATGFAAPHRRDRVFILAYLADGDGERPELQRGIQPQLGIRDHTDRHGAVLEDARHGRGRDVGAPEGGSLGERVGACDRGSALRPGRDVGDSESEQDDERRPRGVGEESGQRRRGDRSDRDASRDVADTGRMFAQGHGAGSSEGDEAEGDRVLGPDRELAHTDGGDERLRREQEVGSARTFGRFPPGPGLGGHGVVDRIVELYRRDPDAAWRMYQAELANTLGWREILTRRPDLAPALSKEDEAELEVRSLDDGISRGLSRLTRRHRLKMLGNAVAPPQVEYLLREVAAWELGARQDVAIPIAGQTSTWPTPDAMLYDRARTREEKEDRKARCGWKSAGQSSLSESAIEVTEVMDGRNR